MGAAPQAALKRPVVTLEFPEKFQPLFQPARYKTFYGGRGSAKSWSFAGALVSKGVNQKLKIVCCREIQKSIGESVKALLENRIEELGLSPFYRITNSEIYCTLTGTEFTFHGLKHNIDNIKSLEGADIVWIEEAVNVSPESWKKLIPTVRKDGSEIWISFNPELETDETYKRFVVRPPTNAIVVKVNWQDNPWFPKVLVQEMEDLRREDEDEYLHVYEGHCVQQLKGAVYAKELRQLTKDERICHVPYSQERAVDVFCDLGFADNTSLWFAQRIAMQYRILRSYQNNLHVWDHYLKEIQDSGFIIGTIYLPHDAKARQLGTGKSIEELTRAKNFKVRLVPKLSLKDGINAVRTILPNCWFDVEGCADGIQALRHYKYEVKSDNTFTHEPKHDENSHYADAFRYFALGYSDKASKSEEAEIIKSKLQKKKVTLTIPTASGGWME
jgi:phage terminase large subunit